MYSWVTLVEGSRLSSFNDEISKRCHALYTSVNILTKVRKKEPMNASAGFIFNRGSFPMKNAAEIHVLQRMYNISREVGFLPKTASRKEDLRTVCYASESSNNETQLRLLESYFAKLQDDGHQSWDSSDEITGLLHTGKEITAKNALDILDAYLGKRTKENYASSSSGDQITESNLVATPFSVHKSSHRGDNDKLKGYQESSRDGGNSFAGPRTLEQNDETSALYLISTLASINIAVFLFQIASPIRTSEFELFSLPLLYGAKINDLILVGEWWRLVTPMFLHSGLFHVSLGCWALLTFGPQVCKNYGSFTFFLLYTLGGISGNLTSFLHTAEPTVGGTGPVFAIIGAWLIYQIQNRDVVAKDVSESMFQKAIIATALSFIISNLGPVDNWTHFGACFTGILYGFFTCPTLQLDDASSRTSQEERITLVRQNADPCKSLLFFAIFIIALSSLLFLVEPPLGTLAP